jgi:hypothetical protein
MGLCTFLSLSWTTHHFNSPSFEPLFLSVLKAVATSELTPINDANHNTSRGAFAAGKETGKNEAVHTLLCQYMVHLSDSGTLGIFLTNYLSLLTTSPYLSSAACFLLSSLLRAIEERSLSLKESDEKSELQFLSEARIILSPQTYAYSPMFSKIAHHLISLLLALMPRKLNERTIDSILRIMAMVPSKFVFPFREFIQSIPNIHIATLFRVLHSHTPLWKSVQTYFFQNDILSTITRWLQQAVDTLYTSENDSQIETTHLSILPAIAFVFAFFIKDDRLSEVVDVLSQTHNGICGTLFAASRAFY